MRIPKGGADQTLHFWDHLVVKFPIRPENIPIFSKSFYISMHSMTI
jgi:hypothetical protein